MKTLNEIIGIVEKEHKENPHRVEYLKEKEEKEKKKRFYISMLNVLTVEGIHKQVENAPEDKEFSIYWAETVPPVDDDALMGGMSISKQKFNNKKEMIPVE